MTLWNLLPSLSLNEKATLALSLLGFLVSALTLYLGYKAYKKFLGQKANEAQLALVLDLVSKIYKYDMHFNWRGPTNHGHTSMNLYMLINKPAFGEPNLNLDDYRILYTDDHLFKFPGLNLLTNPILPQGIAAAMGKMVDSVILSQCYTQNTPKFMVIRPKGAGDLTFKVSRYEYKGGFSSFVKDCRDIDVAIDAWFKQHGIKDINTYMKSNFMRSWYIDLSTDLDIKSSAT